MKIVFLDRSHLQKEHETFDYRSLEDLGELEINDVTQRDEILDSARGAEVLITGKCRITESELREMKSVRLIVKAGTSCDRIDVESAHSLGITVCNLPGYGELPVAQNSMALMLSLAGSLSRYDKAVKDNQWNEVQFCYPSVCVSGKKLGVVGLGSIGRRVVFLAQAFDMEVSVCTRFPDDELGVKYVELDELAGESDFISLHSMLDKHTTGMIGARLLSLMKPTTFLINTARAALVDEDALYSALSEERIAGAAFDGFWQEPAPANHRFLQLRNFLITPHVAWAARETRQGMIESMARVIRSFQSGRAINVVS